MAMERGVATVAVAYPTVPLTEERIRFCISAAHTKPMLDKIINVCDELGAMFGIKQKLVE